MTETVPALQPRPITAEEYWSLDEAETDPELLQGYMYADDEARRRLLRVLLVNVGLLGAVSLAPRALWRAALDATDERSEPAEHPVEVALQVIEAEIANPDLPRDYLHALGARLSDLQGMVLRHLTRRVLREEGEDVGA